MDIHRNILRRNLLFLFGGTFDEATGIMKKYVFLILISCSLSLAHEPIFGIGPGTIFKGGVGIELESNGENIQTEVLYGITEDLSFTAGGNLYPKKVSITFVRMKYRLWKRYAPGTLDAISLIGGVVREGIRDISYILTGIAAGRESRRWYFFGDIIKAKYLMIDFALGIRPWLMEYSKPDLVILSEVNYEDRTGYKIVFLSPAFFFTYRNVAIKGGIQIPYWKTNPYVILESRYSASFEIHF